VYAANRGGSTLSWEFTEGVEEAQKEAESQQHIRASAYHHVFANDAMGQKILTEWVQTYCTGVVPSANASEREVGMMDGKRELVNMILQQISKIAGEQQ
jgi:hypothetical protein